IVTFDTGEHPGVSRQEIGHTELAHLSRRKTTSPVRLDALPNDHLIILDARDPAGALLDAALNSLDKPIETRIVVQTHYVAYSLSENGCGDAIVDLLTGRAMVRPGMYLNRLRPAIQVPISIMTHATDPQSMLHHDFIERLARTCHEL